jgi:hypothetical protein
MQPTITLPRGYGIPKFYVGQRTKQGKIIGIEVSPQKLRGRGQGAGGASPAPEPWSGAEHGYEAPLSRALLRSAEYKLRLSFPPCSLLPAPLPLLTA